MVMALKAKTKQYLIYFFLIFLTSVVTFLSYYQVKSEWVIFREAERNFKNNNYAKATKLYQESVAKGVPLQRVSLNLAHSYVVLGQFNKAVPLYREYLKKYPYDKTVRLALAKALSWTGNFEESEAELQKILELETNKK